MRKLSSKICVVLLVLVSLSTVALGCNASNKKAWKNEFTEEMLALPVINKAGWFETLYDEFNSFKLKEESNIFNDVWTYSPHAMRWETQKKGNNNYTSYWCPDMVTVYDGKVEIKAIESENYKCSMNICPTVGRFSGGIETRKIITNDESENKGTSDKLLFGQAFGYFETSVKFPNAKGLWSAFWMQSSNQRKLGNSGMDGTEIDVFESAFINRKNSVMGHALLWDGYGKQAKSDGYIADLEQNLYDGFHKFALKWTPEYYVFYIDDVPTWASKGGDVARVQEFLRFTVEIDAGDGYGPHGEKIGQFKKDTVSTFLIDYIKVWQNSNYEKYIIQDDIFPGKLDGAN